MGVEAELTRRKPDGTLVPWLVNDDGTEPVRDDAVIAKLDELIAKTTTVQRYAHLQTEPATVWHVPHNLGLLPQVTVLASSGQVVEGEVVYIDNNNLELRFFAPFSGMAILSA